MILGAMGGNREWLEGLLAAFAPVTMSWQRVEEHGGTGILLAGSRGVEAETPGPERSLATWCGTPRLVDPGRGSLGDQLLERWRERGARTTESMVGPFSLALWDANQRRLLLARDRLGFRGMFYAPLKDSQGRRAWVFSSRLTALLGTGRWDRHLDPEAVADLLWNGFVPSPRTLVRGIRALVPGTHLTLESGQEEPSEQRFWQVPDHRPEADGPGRLEDALRSAVDRQTEGTGVALALSGGIDSSAVVALAREVREGTLDTFQLSFPGSDLDETPYAEAVAAELQTRHHVVPMACTDLESCWDGFLDTLDHPTFDGFNTFLLCRTLHGAGFQTLVGGSGGDDVFGGNRTATELPRLQRLSRKARWVPGSWLRPVESLLERRAAGADRSGRRRRLAKLPAIAAAGGDLVQLYQVLYALFSPGALAELLGRDRGQGVGLSPQRQRELAQQVGGNPTLYGISQLELALFVGERMLRDLADVTWGTGVEIRAPLLDEGVIEHFGRVDLAQLYEPVGKKTFLVKAALSRVDPRLWDRPKAGFVLPMEHWLRTTLAPRIGATLEDESACRRAGLQPQVVATLWSGFQAHPGSVYWSRIWLLYVFLEWCRRHQVHQEGCG